MADQVEVDVSPADAVTKNVSGPRPLPKLQFGVLPLTSTKVLHLIRHAEGYHNVAGAVDYANYKLDKFKDAHLTDKGHQQARTLAEHIRSSGLRVDLVVTSTMSRALETAVIAFGQVSPSAGSSGNSGLLMVEREPRSEVMSAHPAVSSHGAPPFIALEVCREHLGVHPCDARRPLAYYKEHFPAVDFSLVEHEEDTLWERERRERDEEVSARGVRFLQWVLQRPERDIAVVSHSGFLGKMLAVFGHDAAPEARAALHRPFGHAELRPVVVFDHGLGV